jgi:drug/metabolite transporter (DMT)-like permease
MSLKFPLNIGKRGAVALIILAGLLWGTSGIFVTFLSAYGFTSIQLTATRFGVSTLILIVYSLIFNRRCFKIKVKDIPLFVLLGVSLFFSCFLYYTSMVKTSVSTAVTLLNMHPVFVTAVSRFVFKERLTPVKISAVLAMVVGGCLVSGIVGGLKFDLWGIVFGLLSAISYASYVLLCKYYNSNNIPSASANLYSFTFMAIIAVSLCDPVSYGKIAIDNAFSAIPILVGLAICTFIIPFVLNGMVTKVLDAGTVSSLSVMEPLSATLYSVILFSEQIGAAQIVGIVLILSAAVILGFGETRRDPIAEKTNKKESFEQEVECLKS